MFALCTNSEINIVAAAQFQSCNTCTIHSVLSAILDFHSMQIGPLKITQVKGYRV
jgi:hypothetical protein